ncbi:MAG TPA: sigma-70 family RNA polymerase sigma factor [Planctomycetaceae bacterium]|nr:sigma-70 family RNA polymerase sigma factor [Planctomycetaceae bacterium]
MSTSSTSLTLLQRLASTEDQEAWGRFVDLYSPLLYCWAQRAGLRDQDAADLVQEAMLLLVRKLPEFRYGPGDHFRGWLRTVLLNLYRDQLRRRHVQVADVDALDVPDPAGSSQFWEGEYHARLAARALELMRAQFAEKTWRACWATVVEGRSPLEVAEELQMSPNSVYVARSRVLRYLREQLTGFWD